jgi:triosephosphate isomerase
MAAKRDKPGIVVAANWKMNPTTVHQAQQLFTDFKKHLKHTAGVTVIVCPTHIHLPLVQKKYSGKTIRFGSQDAHFEKTGSHTGDISPWMLRDMGIQYVILGHSERRAQWETDEIVNKKVEAALKAQLSPIVCIGEHKRDASGEYLTVLKRQIEATFKGLPENKLSKLTIAYEPIWAIGDNGDAISSEELEETILYIRKILAQLFPKQKAMKMPILYGGSVERDNAEALIAEGGVDGFLVGHASRNPKEFAEIIHTAQRYA